MDDEKMFREIIEEILKQVGAGIITVKNGDEAIYKYKKAIQQGKKFDLVVLDMTIVGGDDGITVGKKILDIDNEAVIVISSGHSSHKIFEEYSKHGFKGAIRKPYTTLEFLNHINKILKKEA